MSRAGPKDDDDDYSEDTITTTPKDNYIQYDDYSIARQRDQNFKMLLSPPEVEIPTREYVQRNESTPLPDGSEFEENLEAPVGETVAQFSFRLSKKAREVWDQWVSVNGDHFLVDNKMIIPITKPIDELMLDEYEHKEYIRNKRILFVEEGRYKIEQYKLQQRAIQESINKYDPFKPNTEYIGPNRFVKTLVNTFSQFGDQFKELKLVDRCEGKPNIRHIPGISPANVETSIFSPSYQERQMYINLTDHETNVWRKAYRQEEESKFYSSATSPDDDLDFINPSSMNTGNFSIYPPAARPYNCVFVIHFLDGSQKKIYPSKTSKDYASLSSIIYMLKQKNIKYKKVTIDEIERSGVKFPNCRFEVDLRVTYLKQGEFLPNPVSYLKADPESAHGKKLLLLLNEQPHLWKEYSVGGIDEDGNDVKKLIVYYEVHNLKDGKGPRVYWLYVDSKKFPLSKPRFMRPKIVLPQYNYLTMKNIGYNQLPNYLKREAPLGVQVRMSRNAYAVKKTIGYTPEGEEFITTSFVSFKELEENIFVNLLAKDYIFVHVKPESDCNNVLVYLFLHKDANTSQKRNQIQRKLNGRATD